MSRARFQNQNDWQTAAASENGSGCLSFYVLPPFAALLIVGFVALVALKSPISPAALPVNNSTMVLQSAATNPTPIWSLGLHENTSSSMLSPIFTKEIQHWSNDIVRWANAAAVDPNLAATIMQIESCGDPRALSSAGAMGLFQVMPFHFYPTDNPFDPDTNAARGLAYLKRSLEAAGGNPDLALAGYNGGIGVISRAQTSWAAETQRYIYWGSGIYHDAQAGLSESARLDEWRTRAGGLCSRARQRLGTP